MNQMVQCPVPSASDSALNQQPKKLGRKTKPKKKGDDCEMPPMDTSVTAINAIIQINGREAIPVRAIPFLTNWRVLDPTELAASLSNKGDPGEILGLTAYRLDGNEATPIKPSWWVNVEIDLDSLAHKLKFNLGEYSEWQLQAILKIPAGIFVWKDEFEKCFSESYLDEDSGIDLMENLNFKLLGLDFLPLIPVELEHTVMAGFLMDMVPVVCQSSYVKNLLITAPTTAPTAQSETECEGVALPSLPANKTADIENQIKRTKTDSALNNLETVRHRGRVMKKAALMKKYAHQWPTAKRDFQDALANGLSKAAKAPEHGEWFEAESLNWAKQRGKFVEEVQQFSGNSIFHLTGKKHTIEG